MNTLKNRSLILIAGALISGFTPAMLGKPCSYGHAELQGRRPTMEDAYNVIQSDSCELFGLYDGHGGSMVAALLGNNLNEYIYKKMVPLTKMSDEHILLLLKKSYEDINNVLDKDRCKNQGSTAITALIIGDNIDRTLFIANTGDSRAVLSHEGVAMVLSQDHKPDRPDEYERITKAGGVVINFGVPRVQGVLALSRAMGDFELNPYVICEPEITTRKLLNGDNFLILACDGVWDVLSNQEAVDIVDQELRNSDNAQVAAQKLVKAAYDAGSTDNISAIVIPFGSMKIS